MNPETVPNLQWVRMSIDGMLRTQGVVVSPVEVKVMEGEGFVQISPRDWHADIGKYFDWKQKSHF